MGNRGCLHDGERRIVRDHKPSYRTWILCLLEFNGRKRTVMTPKLYTELFFLDEATGLAAGHRPCGECQRARYRAFVDAWTRGNPGLVRGGAAPRAAEIDSVLQSERLDERREKRVHQADFAGLPDGALVALAPEDRAFLVRGDSLYPWSFEGYGSSVPRPARGVAHLLTPPSIVNALAAGYAAAVHASAGTT